MSTNLVGLMGGTFDPIHNAHLMIADQARVSCGLSKVVFIPNFVSPFKTDAEITEAHHRLAMVRLAISECPSFEISAVEIERGGPSYTVDTLRQIKDIQPPGTELFFIAGADAVAEIENWHKFREVLELCKVVTFERPGTNLGLALSRLQQSTRQRILTLQADELTISSTAIRERIRLGLPIDGLVPPSIAKYINENRLYSP